MLLYRLGAFALLLMLSTTVYLALAYMQGEEADSALATNFAGLFTHEEEKTIALPSAAQALEQNPTEIFESMLQQPSYQNAPLQTEIMEEGEIVSSYVRAASIDMSQSYSTVAGVLTHAGGNYRNSFAYGTQTLSAFQLERIWESTVGSLSVSSGDSYQGTGWTGMPLVIQWSDAVRNTLGVYDMFKSKAGFTEVIYPAMDGYIYFFELSSGERTRDPISIGVVMKGSAALDPRGYPLLYVGQGIMDEVDGRGAWVRAISLIDNTVIWKFGGKDGFSYRTAQAYDSSPLIDADSDTLIVAGENGVLYTTRLHTIFDAEAGTLSIEPEPLVKYRYTSEAYGEGAARVWGVEGSVAVWHGYAFFTDNGGYLQCVDLNSMRLVYAIDLGDESDATVVIEEEEDGVYLYASTLVSFQSVDKDGLGYSYHRKIDALTGEILWEQKQPAYQSNSSSTGGTLSTPHIGKGLIHDLVIYNCTFMPVTLEGESLKGGCLIAYDKATGEERWRYEQEGGYWSSPVVVYDSAGKAYVIQCDRTGILRLHDAATGEALFSLDMGSRIESTPVVFGDYLVVGTKGVYGSGEGPKIIGVKIS